MKFSIFNAEKILCILHGQVFVLSADGLIELRIKYRHLKDVFIDEIAMVGNVATKWYQHLMQNKTEQSWYHKRNKHFNEYCVFMCQYHVSAKHLRIQ